MNTFGQWEEVRELGKGGQGTVYLVRSRARSREIAEARERLRQAVLELTGIGSSASVEGATREMLAQITTLTRPDDPASELAAVKKFEFGNGVGSEGKLAAARLEREVEALRSVQHPSILRLIDANLSKRWFVTEYYPRGSLAKAGPRYKGDALSALAAFSSIVAGVAVLHREGYVHRDIKSNNVFLAAEGGLVLGDFGIVFFEDEAHTRVTEEFEKVGSRDWMAPWAHTGSRVNDVKPSFDIFPLGKLLWTMVSGQRILPPYRTHRSTAFDLETMFPEQPGMKEINSVLDSCIVLDEEKCFPNAEPLLVAVESALKDVRLLTRPVCPTPLTPSREIKCRFCGLGTYRTIGKRSSYNSIVSIQPFATFGGQLAHQGHPVYGNVMVCDNCGHLEMFSSQKTLQWWEL